MLKDKLTVLFIGSGGNIPLDSTNQKKFQRLSQIGNIHRLSVIHSDKSVHRWQECGCEFTGISLSLPRWKRNVWFLWQSVVETIHLARNTRKLVVVAQSPQHAIVPLILRHLSSLRYKLIVEIHGDWLDGYFLYHSFRFDKLAYRILKWGGTWAFRQADAIRTISDATRRLLPAEGSPIYQFPTFTDLDLFIKAAKKREQLLKDQEVQQYLLFVGSFIHLKGVDDLFSAFEKIANSHPEARLIFIGEGVMREELQESARIADLTDRVIFTGHLSQQELARWMVSSYCLVLPSLTEGLGRVLIEAMAVGLPLIGTKVGGIPELIKSDDNGFLVPPACPDQLAIALDWMLGHPNQAMAMGQRGQRRAAKVFSVDRYVQKYQRMLKEVAGTA